MSVTQNDGGFVERLLRAAQRVLGSHMLPLQQWLRTSASVQLSIVQHVAENVHSFHCLHKICVKHHSKPWKKLAL